MLQFVAVKKLTKEFSFHALPLKRVVFFLMKPENDSGKWQ